MTHGPGHAEHSPEETHQLDDAATGATYQRLRGVIAEYRDTEPETGTALSSLRERVMDIVHRESALGPTTELDSPAGRSFEMLTSSIRQVVRGAVDQEFGVIARRVRVSVVDDGGQKSLTLEVSLSMRPDTSVPAIEDVLRERVITAAESLVGIRLTSLDITVVDIHDI